MKLYYRISDKSYQKPKLMGATKEVCLMNFVSVFGNVIFGPDSQALQPADDFVSPLHLVADRCERTTVAMLTETGLPLTLTDKGNAGSFMAAFDMACHHPDDELVYFCEDDYLHLPAAPALLEEGIKRADYVTLYDHPDKYTRFYNGGEYSKVIRTNSSHWRYTASTCMTFAAKVKTLKEDAAIWMKHTTGDHPWDHKIFVELGKEAGRKLAVSIPGAACHTDLTFSGMIGKTLIEPWAIDMMIGSLEEQLLQAGSSVDKGKTGWDRLVALDAMLFDIKKKAK